MVIITETSPEAIKIGDIIEYRTDDSSFIHRVVDIYDEGGQRLFIYSFELPAGKWAMVETGFWVLGDAPAEVTFTWVIEFSRN